MTKRPQRRTTTLSNPLVPAGGETSSPSGRHRPPEREEESRRGGWTRTSFKHTLEEGRRARGAWFHTQAVLGIRPYWQFVQEAVNEKVARLEAEHNEGQPFPALDTVTPGPKPGLPPHRP